MKSQCKVKVKYTWNVTGRVQTSYKMNKSEAKRYISDLRRENKISSHNSKIIRGKSFIPYKNIKIVGCR